MLTYVRIFLILTLSQSLLLGNPPPAEWQIITPVEAGKSPSVNYFPLEFSFDGAPTWNGLNAQVEGTSGLNNAPGYSDKYGYIDFGPDYDQIHIMETWTKYLVSSGGSHTGYLEMWWDDDTDTVNDDGIIETRINFNNAPGAPHDGTNELWIRDKRVNDEGGVRPPRRYLILHSGSAFSSRAMEYAIVGYIYDGLIPPEYANQPKLTIDTNTVIENTAREQQVGTLSISGGEISETYTIEYDTTEDDNNVFRLDNMTLWTTRSHDYENQGAYSLKFNIVDSTGNKTPVEIEILIIDRTGAFDTNGIATAHVAAAYPEINEGDFVIWNATAANDIIYYGAGDISLTAPNKVLIRAGNYSAGISLDLTNVTGTSVNNRVVITNFLGQVYAKKLTISNGSYWRLTGQYDAAKGYGNVDYPGCDGPEGGEQFGFSHGRYGFWISNEWENEGLNIITITGYATGWEMDHIEVSDGGFAGMAIKNDADPTFDMNEIYLHHLYIHDTGSEGIYLGSTDDGNPRHMFNDLTIENILILRAGTEALQIGQLGENCLVRNSVFWGAMDWLSPFQRHQDNCVQIRTRQGGTTFRHNALLGGAEKFYNASNFPRNDITPNGDPITIEHNIHWGCRGALAAYHKETDGVTPWIWRNNFFGHFDYTYNLISDYTTNNGVVVSIASNTVDVIVKDNVFDNTRQIAQTSWGGSTANIISSGNVQKNVVAPKFINLLGKGIDDDVLRWHRWSAKIGEDPQFDSYLTNKGDIITYNIGDIVQHTKDKRTRFYRCLISNTEHEPPLTGDTTWELLTWSNGTRTQFCPPDDARFLEGTFYHQLGIGLGGNNTIDVDTDDLPDRWEKRYGLSASDATGNQGKDGDYDNDQRTNWEEFIQGSNPIIVDQSPNIEITNNGDDYELDWTPPRGRAWKYQYSTDLDEWFDLTTLSSDDTTPTYSATMNSIPHFFRSKIELESNLDLLP